MRIVSRNMLRMLLGKQTALDIGCRTVLTVSNILFRAYRESVYEDKELQRVTVFCPCGKASDILVTSGPQKTLPNGLNVWHAEIMNNQITISPSIGLNAIPGHQPECHI